MISPKDEWPDIERNSLHPIPFFLTPSAREALSSEGAAAEIARQVVLIAMEV